MRTTIRVPRSLWDAVRHRAIDENSDAQELVIRALNSTSSRKGAGHERQRSNFQRKGSAFWWCAYYLRGKEYRESTGETDRRRPRSS